MTLTPDDTFVGEVVDDRLTQIESALHHRLVNVREYKRLTIENAVEAGKLLIEAKGRVKHGGWLPWLEKQGLGERTAQDYMRVARAPKEIIAEAKNVSGALKLLTDSRKSADLAPHSHALDTDASAARIAELEAALAEANAKLAVMEGEGYEPAPGDDLTGDLTDGSEWIGPAPGQEDQSPEAVARRERNRATLKAERRRLEERRKEMAEEPGGSGGQWLGDGPDRSPEGIERRDQTWATLREENRRKEANHRRLAEAEKTQPTNPDAIGADTIGHTPDTEQTRANKDKLAEEQRIQRENQERREAERRAEREAKKKEREAKADETPPKPDPPAPTPDPEPVDPPPPKKRRRTCQDLLAEAEKRLAHAEVRRQQAEDLLAQSRWTPEEKDQQIERAEASSRRWQRQACEATRDFNGQQWRAREAVKEAKRLRAELSKRDLQLKQVGWTPDEQRAENERLTREVERLTKKVEKHDRDRRRRYALGAADPTT